MTNPPSLFARKLRAHRASHGAHGRMTQDQLAVLLGVSVDAIGKYERSLSFIRGDLEHRLAAALGWSRDDILACREDWDQRARVPPQDYLILRETQVVSAFGSVEAVDRAVQAMENESSHDFPDGFSASAPIWAEALRDGAFLGVYVLKNDVLVAHLSLVFLNRAQEAAFTERRLRESRFSLETLRRPLLPGDYFGYCAGLYIAHGHQQATLPLLSGCVDLFEDLLGREVMLRQLGAISCTPIGRQLCEDLGFHHIGPHLEVAELDFWVMSGAGLSNSLLARRSPKLRRAYTQHFAA